MIQYRQIKKKIRGTGYLNENDKYIDKEEIASGMVLFGLGGLILTAVFVSFIGVLSIILFIIEVLSIVIGLIILKIESNKNEAAHAANINAFQKEYDEYTHKLGIVKSDTQVTLIETHKDDCEADIPHYLWIDNGMLNIFPMAQYYIQWHTSASSRPNISELKLKSILIKSILYFEEVGEVKRYEIEIPEKSIIKKVLFGEAILDGRGKVVGIKELTKPQIVTEDNSKVELVYENAKNKKETLVFKHDAYEILKRIIPSKLQE